MTLLQESIIHLLAAIISVPISKRLGFGSVLGYLCAGILIGPFGFGFVHEADHILHLAELGVVFLLFIIGLDLIFRDTLLSSLAMGESVLEKLGLEKNEVRQVSDTFRDADEKLLLEQHALQGSEKRLVQSATDAAAELESILEQDLLRQG